MVHSRIRKYLEKGLAIKILLLGFSSSGLAMDHSAALPFTCQAQYTGSLEDLSLNWTRPNHDHALARRVVTDLLNAKQHGLNPSDYNAQRLVERLNQFSSKPRPQYPGSADANLKRLNRDITQAAVCYLQQVRNGQLEPEMVHAKTLLKPKTWKAADALHQAWQSGQVQQLFDTSPPPSRQYRLLASNLKRLQKNLSVKVKITARKKVEQQIAQVELAMERIRWMPRDTGQRRIEVNIPEFKVRMRSRGRLLHQSKVIVGKPGHRATPLFVGKLSRVDLNPSWYVPNTIARYMLLPMIRKDPDYVSRKNLIFRARDGTVHTDVTDKLLKLVERRKIRIVQQPGDDNALGLYKFVLPNRRAIFMHDTNQPELFDADVRAFSSGCVRVQHADKLARKVLLGSQWNRARLGEQMSSGETKAINPKRATMVVLQYQTARAINSRRVQFFKDLYGMDTEAYSHVKRWSRAFSPVQRQALL